MFTPGALIRTEDLDLSQIKKSAAKKYRVIFSIGLEYAKQY